MNNLDTNVVITSAIGTGGASEILQIPQFVPNPATDLLIKGIISIVTGLLTGLLTKWLENRKFKHVNP